MHVIKQYTTFTISNYITVKNSTSMKKTGITEKLKAIELNVLVEIPAQECEYMAIRSLCHRIGGKWDVKKNGLVTYVKRLEL